MEFKLYFSKSKIKNFEIVSFAIFVPAVICLFIGEIDTFFFKFDLFCIFFSGIFSLYFFKIRNDKKCQIILSEKGLFNRSLSNQFILWEHIKTSYVVSVYGQKTINIILVKGKKIETNYKSFIGFVNKIYKIKGFSLSLSFIDCDEDKIAIYINEFLNSDDQKREKLLKELTSNYYV